MSFNASDNKLLKKYNKIWEKVSSLMKTEFDSEPGYGDKYVNTKIKSYEDRIDTDFYGKGIPKGNVACNCLSLLMLESVIRTHKRYYPQTLLEDCKYEIKKKKIEKLINDLELSLSDKSDSESDNGSVNDESND